MVRVEGGGETRQEVREAESFARCGGGRLRQGRGWWRSTGTMSGF